MNERDDYEMAAKAAGKSPSESDGVIYAGFGSREWAPRDDDGDAFRLASALHLHILHNDQGEAVLWVSAVLDKRGLHGVAEFQEEDQRVEATRLAIFRAAVAIGRAMP